MIINGYELCVYTHRTSRGEGGGGRKVNED